MGAQIYPTADQVASDLAAVTEHLERRKNAPKEVDEAPVTVPHTMDTRAWAEIRAQNRQRNGYQPQE